MNILSSQLYQENYDMAAGRSFSYLGVVAQRAGGHREVVRKGIAERLRTARDMVRLLCGMVHYDTIRYVNKGHKKVLSLMLKVLIFIVHHYVKRKLRVVAGLVKPMCLSLSDRHLIVMKR